MKKARVLYDLKMIVYTVICILYALVGKECTWILNELRADAKASGNDNVNVNLNVNLNLNGNGNFNDNYGRDKEG